MVKRNAFPSYVAFPWIATLVMGVHLLHFNTDIVTISANVTAAIVAVQTPITVIFGAILFNKFSCFVFSRKKVYSFINPTYAYIYSYNSTTFLRKRE